MIIHWTEDGRQWKHQHVSGQRMKYIEKQIYLTRLVTSEAFKKGSTKCVRCTKGPENCRYNIFFVIIVRLVTA